MQHRPVSRLHAAELDLRPRRQGGGTAGGVSSTRREWLATWHRLHPFCPNFFGNPADRNYIWPSSLYQNYNEQSLYFGLVPLALAAGRSSPGPGAAPGAHLAALAGFCLAVAWHLPGFEAVSHLPIFSMAPNKRLRLPFVFMTAVMAGFGFDALLRQLGGRRDRARLSTETPSYCFWP